MSSRTPREEALLDKFRGCLVAGAAGDALGYPVEFMSATQIRAVRGPDGIHALPHDPQTGLALVSDDTQMTLFTAAGILVGAMRHHLDGVAASPDYYVWRSYLDWLHTQEPEGPAGPHESWLADVEALRGRRAPGRTCLAALEYGRAGSIDEPLNDSKGCGGIMRVAPVALLFGAERDGWADGVGALDDAALLGADVAAVTHGDPLGYIPAAAAAYLVHRCAYEMRPREGERQARLMRMVDECRERLSAWFPRQVSATHTVSDLLRQAMGLAGRDVPDKEAARELGEGWVAEETLAIAVCSCLRHADDVPAALAAAVGHDGDSDSCGAVAGNIMGAMHGMSGIDPAWLQDLELEDVTIAVADDLADAAAGRWDVATTERLAARYPGGLEA
jgi:ADP-ribosylglycohydrolase